MAQQHTPAAGSGQPAFELESYEDGTLPHNTRLNEPEELVGHTITHVFTDCSERGDSGEWLLVTETGCWIVLEPKVDAFDSNCADVAVVRDRELSAFRLRKGRPQRLSDFISPSELLDARLIGDGEAKLLMAEKQAVQENARQKEASRLRQALAELEGSAALSPSRFTNPEQDA